MPQGTVLVRLQNSTTTGETLTRVSYEGDDAQWNNAPPQTIAANASSANLQVSYNFNTGEQATFSVRYSIPSETIPYTASCLIDETNNTVTVNPNGASPGNHSLTFVTAGAPPNSQVLFTFS